MNHNNLYLMLTQSTPAKDELLLLSSSSSSFLLLSIVIIIIIIVIIIAAVYVECFFFSIKCITSTVTFYQSYSLKSAYIFIFSTNSEYLLPFIIINSSCLPCSMILPSSNTYIQSASCTVLSRLAMTINVLALLWPNTVKDCWIACSVSVSNDDVAYMSYEL